MQDLKMYLQDIGDERTFLGVKRVSGSENRSHIASDGKFYPFEEYNEANHTSLKGIFSKDVTEVGTITPEQDFLTLLKKGEPFYTVTVSVPLPSDGYDYDESEVGVDNINNIQQAKLFQKYKPTCQDNQGSFRHTLEYEKHGNGRTRGVALFLACSGRLREMKTDCMFAVLTSWCDTFDSAAVVKGSSTMQDAIMKLVMHSFGSDGFIKAVAALKLLREKCKELFPDLFNQWLLNLKENLIERGKVGFWNMILKGSGFWEPSLSDRFEVEGLASCGDCEHHAENLWLIWHSHHQQTFLSIATKLLLKAMTCIADILEGRVRLDNIGLISVVENPGSTVTAKDAEIFFINSVVKATDSEEDLMDAENLFDEIKSTKHGGPISDTHAYHLFNRGRHVSSSQEPSAFQAILPVDIESVYKPDTLVTRHSTISVEGKTSTRPLVKKAALTMEYGSLDPPLKQLEERNFD
uniref:Ku C-terminal domain-containing protein n=1 Tax=Timema bartmani TaxID=61472 RepID=A0A7R9ES75_9NEOP|nr:unnamed protein product [Timema bartmani]